MTEPSMSQTSRDPVVETADDDRGDAFTPDDILMVAVLLGIFAGTVGLLIYVMLGGTDDLVSMLRK